MGDHTGFGEEGVAKSNCGKWCPFALKWGASMGLTRGVVIVYGNCRFMDIN